MQYYNRMPEKLALFAAISELEAELLATGLQMAIYPAELGAPSDSKLDLADDIYAKWISRLNCLPEELDNIICAHLMH